MLKHLLLMLKACINLLRYPTRIAFLVIKSDEAKCINQVLLLDKLPMRFVKKSNKELLNPSSEGLFKTRIIGYGVS